MRRPQGFTLAAAVCAFGLGLVCVMTGQGQGTSGPVDVAQLVTHESKNMETDLSKATFTKKGQKRVKMAAFMVAAYAKQANDAALYDSAVKLMKAADEGNA